MSILSALAAVEFSNQTLVTIGLYLICLVLSIAVHEYGHALVADRLGDPTPDSEGRVSLNPLVHADPVGTLIMPVVAVISSFPLLGWGRPVPTRPSNYTRKVSMRGGMALVAAAGPFGNLVLVLVVLGITAVMARTVGISEGMHKLLWTMLQLNVILMLFNLLPLHPLDGGKILAAFLPPRLEYIDEFLMQYGPWILLGLVIFGGGVLAQLFVPLQKIIANMYLVAGGG